MSRPRSRLPLIICLIGAGLGVFCAGGGAYAYFVGIGPFDIGSAASKVGKAAEEYRKAGMPWEAKDIAPNPPVAPEENAAKAIRAAMASMKKPGISASSGTVEFLIDTGQFSKAEAELRPHFGALDLAVAASKKPRVDFGRDYDLGAVLLFPELAQMRTLVRGLVQRAQIRAGQGKVEASIADLRAAKRLGVLAGMDSNLISLLVRVACERIYNDAVQRCAATWQHNPLALNSLLRMFKENDAAFDLQRTFRGEAYMGLATIRNLVTYKPALDSNFEKLPEVKDKSKIIRTGVPKNLVARSYVTRHCELWLEVDQAVKDSKGDLVAISDEMKLIAKRLDDRKSMSNLLNHILFPVFDQSIDAVLIAKTERESVIALLTAMASEKSSDLATLRALAGKYIDPWSRSQLSASVSPGNVRVYSVGPDRVDNGGVHRSELRTKEKKVGWDVVASFPPRSRPRQATTD